MSDERIDTTISVEVINLEVTPSKIPKVCWLGLKAGRLALSLNGTDVAVDVPKTGLYRVTADFKGGTPRLRIEACGYA